MLHLRAPGKTHKLLISLHPERSRFHFLEGANPPAIVPNSFVMLCRKRVGGTWLESVRQHGLDRKVEFHFNSGHGLVFDWAGRPSALLLLHSESRDVVAHYPSRGRFRRKHPYPIESPEKPSPLDLSSEQAWELVSALPPETAPMEALSQTMAHWPRLWRKRFQQISGKEKIGELTLESFSLPWQRVIEPLKTSDAFSAGLETDGEVSYCCPSPQFDSVHEACRQRWLDKSLAPGTSDYRQELIKKLQKHKDKAQRKLKKRLQDRKGAETAPQDQLRGDLLLAYASGLGRGTDSFQTSDWEGRPLTIQLDPKLSATENADRYYSRAKKKRRALAVLGEQIEKAEQEIEMWDELLYAAQTSENQTDLDQVRKSMPVSQARSKKRKVPEVPSSGPRRFSHHDFLILVGRNPAQNDKLSLKSAAKDDHWFHVRQGAGSHVLIRAAGREPTPETVEAAAWLAAHYSASSDSGAVEVVTTRARFLKKPKGGPLGKVIYRQETEIVVDPTQPRPAGLSEQNKNEAAP